MLAAICCLKGELEQAIALSEDCLRLSGDSGERWCHSYALYSRGLARGMKGEIGPAADDGRAALRMKWDIGDRMGVAMVVDLLGGVAMAVGDAERASRLFGAAENMWLTLGSPMFGRGYTEVKAYYSKQARKLLGEEAHAAACKAGARMKAPEAVAYALGEMTGTDPLTRREREISELVAEGLSNREIAERLVIAKRTVDSHLEHILAKLEFTSRTQIASWVSSHREN
jgi:DNA-binding CsgD family transcriptional regulator